MFNVIWCCYVFAFCLLEYPYATMPWYIQMKYFTEKAYG